MTAAFLSHRILARAIAARVLTLAVPVLALPGLAGAQQAEAKPAASGSRVSGVAFYSVHMNPLVGALIRVEGTDRQAVADRTGAFVLDDIPPGTWPLKLIHPLLDTLGLQIGTRPIQFPLASEGQVTLATPSAETIVAGSCTAAQRRAWGPSMVMGRVMDADTDSAAVGTK